VRKFIFLAVGFAFLALAAWGLLSGNPERVLPEGVTFYHPDIDFFTMAWHKESDEKALYAGGRNGLYIFDEEFFIHIENFPGTYVRALLSESETLYIGCEQGLYEFDGVSFNLIFPQRIQCLAMTDEGLWAGTLDGAYRINDGFHLSNENGLLADYVNVILPLSSGGILFGNYQRDGGITLYYDGKTTTFTVEDGLPHPYITSFLETDGKVWVGTGFFDQGGACLITVNGGKITLDTVVLKPDGLAGDKVRNIYIDDTGNIWFASEADGVAIFSGNKPISLLTDENYLVHNEVLCFLEDRENGIIRGLWLGTPSGCVYFDETAYFNAQGAR